MSVVVAIAVVWLGHQAPILSFVEDGEKLSEVQKTTLMEEVRPIVEDDLRATAASNVPLTSRQRQIPFRPDKVSPTLAKFHLFNLGASGYCLVPAMSRLRELSRREADLIRLIVIPAVSSNSRDDIGKVTPQSFKLVQEYEQYSKAKFSGAGTAGVQVRFDIAVKCADKSLHPYGFILGTDIEQKSKVSELVNAVPTFDIVNGIRIFKRTEEKYRVPRFAIESALFLSQMSISIDAPMTLSQRREVLESVTECVSNELQKVEAPLKKQLADVETMLASNHGLRLAVRGDYEELLSKMKISSFYENPVEAKPFAQAMKTNKCYAQIETGYVSLFLGMETFGDAFVAEFNWILPTEVKNKSVPDVPRQKAIIKSRPGTIR
jgi:hypothetical protein